MYVCTHAWELYVCDNIIARVANVSAVWIARRAMTSLSTLTKNNYLSIRQWPFYRRFKCRQTLSDNLEDVSLQQAIGSDRGHGGHCRCRCRCRCRCCCRCLCLCRTPNTKQQDTRSAQGYFFRLCCFSITL